MTGFPFKPEKAVAHLRSADPVLARIIDGVGPFRMELKVSPSLFGSLAEAIVYQQLSNKAAATIFGRVEALYPHSPDGFTPSDILETPEEQLRGCGLSRAKVLALQDLARRVDDCELPTLDQAQSIPDADLIDCMVKVRGIGRWSAHMFLMFRLGRPDILPIDDYSLRKAYATALGKPVWPSPEELERIGRKWRPYRTVASWYLWRVLDQPPA